MLLKTYHVWMDAPKCGSRRFYFCNSAKSVRTIAAIAQCLSTNRSATTDAGRMFARVAAWMVAPVAWVRVSAKRLLPPLP